MRSGIKGRLLSIGSYESKGGRGGVEGTTRVDPNKVASIIIKKINTYLRINIK